MAKHFLTKRARADLAEIGRYTLKVWGKDQRTKYLTMLYDSFNGLANKQLLGSDCDEIEDDYKKYIAGRHVIFFVLLPTGDIKIVRVLHERMDIVYQLSLWETKNSVI